MKKNWKVEIRENCKICNGELPNARHRTYCSKECRNKRNNAKQSASGYSTKWQKAKRDKIAEIPDPDKCQCLYCNGWYIGVKSHINQVHKYEK